MFDSFGIPLSEVDTSTRRIQSASPENPVLFQIHTDSSLQLRIRLLENPPKTEPKLLQKMHFSGLNCGESRLTLTNRNLTHQRNDDIITVEKVFIHQSRVYFINRYFENFYEIRSYNGKFFTSLPRYFFNHYDWSKGDFQSYDNLLLYVPIDWTNRISAVFISEDFFRDYEVIPGFEHRTYHLHHYSSYVSIFQSELLGITKRGAQFYDGQDWKDFGMEWGGLEPTVRENSQYNETIKFMVIHTKHRDHLFAFAGPGYFAGG